MLGRICTYLDDRVASFAKARADSLSAVGKFNRMTDRWDGRLR